MCEPLTLGLITAAGSLAATGASMYTQSQAVNRQEKADAEWAAYQRKTRAEEHARQDDLRQRTETARQETLGELDPTKQQQAQETEATKLTTDFARTPEAAQAEINNQLLSGEISGGQNFKDDYARRMTQASQDARKRIAALATIQSYGGSFGGLGTRNQQVLGQGDENIKMLGNMRGGSLGAYGAEQAVDPLKYKTVSNPWGGVASTLASTAGSSFGNYFGKA
jgi:hypothetical protein